MKTETSNEIILTAFRTVGFTNSYYASGGHEVGWTGEFCRTRSEAETAGCGVSESYHSGEETRQYDLLADGTVLVDGEEAGQKTCDEFPAEFENGEWRLTI